jgi:hypothetical protein
LALSPLKGLVILVKGASDSLAGRISFVDLTGFTLEEPSSEHLLKRWWQEDFSRSSTYAFRRFWTM